MYKVQNIQDLGFKKWTDAFDDTFSLVKWVSLFINFKFYRMTYSFFMGKKNFLVLFQKKKFKKHIILTTLISQFLCELPIIISSLVSMGTLPFGE